MCLGKIFGALFGTNQESRPPAGFAPPPAPPPPRPAAPVAPQQPAAATPSVQQPTQQEDRPSAGTNDTRSLLGRDINQNSIVAGDQGELPEENRRRTTLLGG